MARAANSPCVQLWRLALALSFLIGPRRYAFRRISVCLRAGSLIRFFKTIAEWERMVFSFDWRLVSLSFPGHSSPSLAPALSPCGLTSTTPGAARAGLVVVVISVSATLIVAQFARHGLAGRGCALSLGFNEPNNTCRLDSDLPMGLWFFSPLPIPM